MKPILFVLFLFSSYLARAESVIFPDVDLSQLSSVTTAAVEDWVETTIPFMELSKDLGAPTLMAVSQDADGRNTRYELEVEIELKVRNSISGSDESVCSVELDGSLNVLYVSCGYYEPEPFD